MASSNSGMGCGPEWPLCNGNVVPTLKGDTLIEFAHRVIGAVLGVLTIWLFIKMILAKIDYTARLVAFFMIGLLIVQVLLGAIVVVRDLPSIIITIHLIVAMLFLASLIWIWRYPGLEESTKQAYSMEGRQGTVIKHLNILLVLLLLTLAFGAYIKHESYGFACGWFGCRQSFFPASAPEFLQTIHRVLAVISTIYLIFLTFVAFVIGWGRRIQRRFVLSTLTVLFQLVIGAAVVMTSIEIQWAVLHLAVATCLFAFISETRVYAGNRMLKTNTRTLSGGNWHSGRESLD